MWAYLRLELAATWVYLGSEGSPMDKGPVVCNMGVPDALWFVSRERRKHKRRIDHRLGRDFQGNEIAFSRRPEMVTTGQPVHLV